MKLCLVVFLFFTSLAASAQNTVLQPTEVPAAAADGNDQLAASQALEALAKTYQASKEEVAANETKKRQILGALYQIHAKMKKINRHRSQLTDEMLMAQNRVDELSRNIANLEGTIKLQRDRLSKRLRVMYKFGSQGFVKSMFSSQTAPELDRFLKYLKIVSERDYRLMKEYQHNIRYFKAQKSNLTHEVQRLAGLKNRIHGEEDQLSQQNQNTRDLLSQLDAKNLRQMNQVKNLRDETRKLVERSNRLDHALLKLLEPSFFEQRGQLAPPVQGQITRKFGFVTDSTGVLQFAHKGVFFSAAQGSPILAPFGGTVQFAGWIDGYGKSLVIDHGHHYYTVYAHMSELNVRSGDKVQTGQKIARVGNTCHELGAGLYFEVRHFSEPEDPAPWIKNVNVQVSQLNESSWTQE